MKFFIVMLAVVTLAYAEDEWMPKNDAEVSVIRQECIKNFPLSEEQLQKFRIFEYPEEEAIRKYLLCVTKAVGIFTEHEGYHADRVAKQFNIKLDEAEGTIITEGCADKNVEGSSADVWAYRIHKCVMASKLGERVKAYIQNLKDEGNKH